MALIEAGWLRDSKRLKKIQRPKSLMPTGIGKDDYYKEDPSKYCYRCGFSTSRDDYCYCPNCGIELR